MICETTYIKGHKILVLSGARNWNELEQKFSLTTVLTSINNQIMTIKFSPFIDTIQILYNDDNLIADLNQASLTRQEIYTIVDKILDALDSFDYNVQYRLNLLGKLERYIIDNKEHFFIVSNGDIIHNPDHRIGRIEILHQTNDDPIIKVYIECNQMPEISQILGTSVKELKDLGIITKKRKALYQLSQSSNRLWAYLVHIVSSYSFLKSIYGQDSQTRTYR